MIKGRFILHLFFFVSFLAIFIPLVTVVTVPTFDFNSNFVNTTCSVVNATTELSGSNSRAVIVLDCNNPINSTLTAYNFRGVAYSPEDATYTSDDKTGFVQTYIEHMTANTRVRGFLRRDCFGNSTLLPAYVDSCNATSQAMFSTNVPNLTLLYLSYQGWAIVLELLAGVVGVMSIVGMIISACLNPDQVEGYQKKEE